MVSVALLLTAVSLTSAVAVGTPTLVIGGRGEQYDPFASGSLVAYTTWASKHAHAFVRDLTGGSTTRLEASGQAEANGFDPTTGEILFTRWDSETNGNLLLYDPATGDRAKVDGVNTPRWEWDGRISATYILFLQERRTDGVWYIDVRLMPRDTSDISTIKTYRSKNIAVVNAGSVGDRYATWTVCFKDLECRAILYDAQTPTLTAIPTKNGKRQYAPVVDEGNGNVYFTRLGGSRWCRNVNVWRLPVDDLNASPTKVLELPDGKDTGWTSSLSVDAGTGEIDYYYERYICSKVTGDVYVLPGVDTA